VRRRRRRRRRRKGREWNKKERVYIASTRERWQCDASVNKYKLFIMEVLLALELADANHVRKHAVAAAAAAAEQHATLDHYLPI
jgi:hypothetical protein